MSGCLLGCAESYTASFTDSTGSAFGDYTIASFRAERSLDDIGHAKLEISTMGDCCESVARITPWLHTVTISRDNTIIWFGWVTRVEYKHSSVVVEASDAAVWFKYRVIGEDILHTDADLSTIFVDYFNASIGRVNPGVSVERVGDSGVSVDREVLALSRLESWFEIVKLLQEGLDMLIIGNRILVGGLGSVPVASLSDNSFLGDGFSVVKDGLQQANSVFVNGSGAVIGEYHSPSSGLLLERSFSHPNIEDEESANTIAETRWQNRSNTPVYVVQHGGSVLSPDATICVEDINPGMIVNVFSSMTCLDISSSMRLSRIIYMFNEAGEEIRVNLQPVGIE